MKAPGSSSGPHESLRKAWLFSGFSGQCGWGANRLQLSWFTSGGCDGCMDSRAFHDLHEVEGENEAKKAEPCELLSPADSHSPEGTWC